MELFSGTFTLLGGHPHPVANGSLAGTDIGPIVYTHDTVEADAHAAKKTARFASAGRPAERPATGGHEHCGDRLTLAGAQLLSIQPDSQGKPPGTGVSFGGENTVGRKVVERITCHRACSCPEERVGAFCTQSSQDVGTTPLPPAPSPKRRGGAEGETRGLAPPPEARNRRCLAPPLRFGEGVG